MGGGYDIAGAETALRPGAQAGRAQAAKLSEAENELRAAQSAQEVIVRDADTLDEVRRARNASLDASKRVALLDKTLELAQAKRALALTKSRLAELPPGLEKWRGTEPEELETLRARLVGTQRDQELAHRTIAGLDRAIARDGLNDPVPADVLDELDSAWTRCDPRTTRGRPSTRRIHGRKRGFMRPVPCSVRMPISTGSRAWTTRSMRKSTRSLALRSPTHGRNRRSTRSSLRSGAVRARDRRRRARWPPSRTGCRRRL